MIFKNIEFHNVAEIEETKTGYRMYRFPRDLCDKMGHSGRTHGRYVSQTTTGCELRFVMNGTRALLSLTSIDEDTYVQIFRGEYAYYNGYTYSFPVKKGVITHILLEDRDDFRKLDPKLRNNHFSANVWRVMTDINSTIAFVDIETFGNAIRPPRPDEVPDKTLLCYGTSLTYGACATSHCISYVQLLGRLLGCNILNKAMGGSCMSEKWLSDWFVSGFHQYDGVLLENGVNLNRDPKYEELTDYFLKKLFEMNPSIPVYCLTSFPRPSVLAEDSIANPCSVNMDCEYANDRLMRKLTERYPNSHLIEGYEMMDNLTNLTHDLIHMSDYGHIMAAMNLAKRITI